jgi:hypothetical protein
MNLGTFLRPFSSVQVKDGALRFVPQQYACLGASKRPLSGTSSSSAPSVSGRGVAGGGARESGNTCAVEGYLWL